MWLEVTGSKNAPFRRQSGGIIWLE